MVEPHRIFILQGRARVHRYNKDNSVKDAKARKKHHLLLFNDILVMAKPKKDSFDSESEEEKEKDKEKETELDKNRDREKEEMRKKKQRVDIETGPLRYVRYLELKDCELEEEPAKEAPKFSFRLQHLPIPYCISFSDAEQKEKWWNEIHQGCAERRKHRESYSEEK